MRVKKNLPIVFRALRTPLEADVPFREEVFFDSAEPSAEVSVIGLNGGFVYVQTKTGRRGCLSRS